jgi:hypothetical protein
MPRLCGVCAGFANYAKTKCISRRFRTMVLQIQFIPSKRMECTMNSQTTRHSTGLSSASLSYEARSAIYDEAKRRAQSLRRDAISGLIDDAIAWLFHRPRAAHGATQTRVEASCRS